MKARERGMTELEGDENVDFKRVLSLLQFISLPLTFFSNASFCFVSSVVFTREAQRVEHSTQRVLSCFLGEGAEIARRVLRFA